MNPDRDPIEAYRQRLEAASAALAPDLRADLLDDVQIHLDEIRRTSTSPAEVRTALDRLGAPEQIVQVASGDGDLAPPAAGGDTLAVTMPRTAEPMSTPRSPGVRGRDVTAILLVVFGLVVGALAFIFLPPLMPVAAVGAYATGLVLLWTSRTWTTGEKLLASLVWPGGIAAPLTLGVFSTQVCTTEQVSETIETATGRVVQSAGEVITECTGFALPPAIGVPLLVALVAAPIVVGLLLLARASRRAAD